MTIPEPIYQTCHCKFIPNGNNTYITHKEYYLFRKLHAVQFFCKDEFEPDGIQICLN